MLVTSAAHRATQGALAGTARGYVHDISDIEDELSGILAYLRLRYPPVNRRGPTGYVKTWSGGFVRIADLMGRRGCCERSRMFESKKPPSIMTIRVEVGSGPGTSHCGLSESLIIPILVSALGCSGSNSEAMPLTVKRTSEGPPCADPGPDHYAWERPPASFVETSRNEAPKMKPRAMPTADRTGRGAGQLHGLRTALANAR